MIETKNLTFKILTENLDADYQQLRKKQDFSASCNKVIKKIISFNKLCSYPFSKNWAAPQ